MAATAMSIPIMMMKRGDPTGFFSCVSDAMLSGTWMCKASIMSTDIGIVTNVMVMPLTIERNPPGGAEFNISSSSLQANVITPPFLKAWPLTQSKERATVVYKDKDIASFETAMSPTTVAGNKVSSVLPPAELSILVGAENNFSTFIAALLGLPSITFSLKGTLDATLELPVAGLPPKKTAVDIPGIAYNSPITLTGCDGFPGIKFSNLTSFTQDAVSKKYTLEGKITVDNPSDLVVKLGELRFQTADAKGNAIGISVFKDFHLERGPNTLTVTTTTTTTAEEASLDALLSALTSTGSTFHLSGYKGSSDSQILADGLLNFKTTIDVPKLPAPSSA
ncbi:hypothetical protein BGZ75_010141 [Mortierella antarctica]|nr:hypothetical protein BGZ75_010141 [Mortierella antarctica]